MEDFPTKEKAIYEMYLIIKWILWNVWNAIPVYF
jgi:hypothetical protein